MKLNARIEREEPRLGNRWNLRGVLHFKEKKRRPLTIVVREINGLGLQIRKYGLDGCAKFSGLRRRVPGLDGNAYSDKKSYRSSPRNGGLSPLRMSRAGGLPLIDRDLLGRGIFRQKDL